MTRARSRPAQNVDSIGLIVFAVATTGRYGTGLRAGKCQVSFAGELDGGGWLLQGAFVPSVFWCEDGTSSRDT